MASLSIVEVHKAVFSMKNNKSLGPDGMSLVYFKMYWNIVGKDLVSIVTYFFQNLKLSTTTNHTFIALIPRKQAANRVEQFKPIALCNVTYKAITKIMSNHLKNSLDKLIHLNQSAFIPIKSIIDNGIIDKVACNFW